MQISRKRYTYTYIVVTAVAIAFFCWQRQDLPALDENPPDSPFFNHVSDRKSASTSRTPGGKKQPAKLPIAANQTPQEILALLKIRWIALKTSDPTVSDYEAREVLARESIEMLLYSPELFDLDVYLLEEGIVPSLTKPSLESFLYEAIDTDLAGAIRKSFLDCVLSKATGSVAFNQNKETFAKRLGYNISPKEFAEFRIAMQEANPALCHPFVMGYASYCTESNPSVALDSLHLLHNEQANSPGIINDESYFSTVIQFTNDVEKLQDIERFVDSVAPKYDELIIQTARREILYVLLKQGEVSAATDRVLSNNGNYPQKMIEDIATLAVYDMELKQTGSGIAWIESLPEGNLRDLAIKGAVRSIFETDLDMAKRIANLMDATKKSVYLKNYPSVLR